MFGAGPSAGRVVLGLCLTRPRLVAPLELWLVEFVGFAARVSGGLALGSRKEFFFSESYVDFCCGEKCLSRLEDVMAHTFFL